MISQAFLDGGDAYLECDSPALVAWNRLDAAPISARWSDDDEPEAALHRIHAYPAKFPAFLARRALAYAAESGVRVSLLGDVFCGCGTVAHEARRAGLAFWGCDINPVAILIARAKTLPLKGDRLRALSEEAISGADSVASPTQTPELRRFLLRWHSAGQVEALGRLLAAIERTVSPRSPYRTALLCAFSSILRSCSYWKAWSTKPRIDLGKKELPVERMFRRACERMAVAYDKTNWSAGPAPMLRLADVRTVTPPNRRANLLVCSAPYATSVDYAELHQLSAAWLGYFTELDHLRRASIGTPRVAKKMRDCHAMLNRVGLQAVFALYEHDPAGAAAIANYFVDMQQVARRCLDFLAPHGIAVFVIGNARLRGMIIDNAAHFTEALLEAGFTRVRVVRRQVRNKAKSPFRDVLGRLQSEPTEHRQYEQEFVLIAHRP